MGVLVVSYGAGVDSTAMLIGLYHRNMRPDLILFADTGAEKPGTYLQVLRMQAWLEDKGWPPIHLVRYVPPIAPYADLEGNCLANETLPSLAFGRKSCSMKWKVAPQHAFLRRWLNGRPFYHAIGYDYGAADRKRRASQDRKVQWAIGLDSGRADRKRALNRAGSTYAGGKGLPGETFWYPLQEWGWTREQCVREIQRAGMVVPPKSSCFFCPAMKPAEIEALRDEHPDLFARALTIEQIAQTGHHGLRTVKGLGRRFAWSDYAKEV